MARRPVGLLLLVLAVLAPWTAGDPAGAQAGRATPPEPPVVVDASGREVGPIVEILGPFTVVLLRADGRDATLVVFRDRLVSLLAAAYESPDCTGPPWARDFVQVPLVEPAAIGRLNELLVRNGDPETRTLTSEWNSFSTPPACQTPPAETRIVRPTRVLVDLNGFQPPFRLR